MNLHGQQETRLYSSHFSWSTMYNEAFKPYLFAGSFSFQTLKAKTPQVAEFQKLTKIFVPLPLRWA